MANTPPNENANDANAAGAAGNANNPIVNPIPVFLPGEDFRPERQYLPPRRDPMEQKNQMDYDMYYLMAKSLTLQLPFERDRVIASKWVKKIDVCENVEQVVRTKYLKLLCVSMFSHKLAGPFKLIPSDRPELDEIGDITSSDIIADMVEEATIFKTTPYYVEMSGDLKEYAAYQEIPNFGAHFYYAFSNETILNWHNEKRAIVPSGGLNYPILNPPPRQISKSADAFKSAYKKYANPGAKGSVPSDLLPNLVGELHMRKIINKEEIAKMGTKKLLGEACKCALKDVQNKLKPGGLAGVKLPGCLAGSSNGRPAACGANKNGRPGGACAALRRN